MLKLTPLEIRKQNFRKILRGFDPIEVQTFLEVTAEQHERLLEEKKTLEHQLIELETRLHDYQENDKTLRETLLNVQEVKKQSEESSRQQADFLIKEAELKALEILENARKEARQTKEEISWLKSQKESFINRIRHVLVSQIELLSVMEIDDIIPEENKASLHLSTGRKHLHQSKAKASPSSSEAVEEETKEYRNTSKAKQEKKRSFSQKREIITLKDQKSPKASSFPHKKGLLNGKDINNFFKKGIQLEDFLNTSESDNKEVKT